MGIGFGLLLIAGFAFADWAESKQDFIEGIPALFLGIFLVLPWARLVRHRILRWAYIPFLLLCGVYLWQAGAETLYWIRASDLTPTIFNFFFIALIGVQIAAVSRMIRVEGRPQETSSQEELPQAGN